MMRANVVEEIAEISEFLKPENIDRIAGSVLVDRGNSWITKLNARVDDLNDLIDSWYRDIDRHKDPAGRADALHHANVYLADQNTEITTLTVGIRRFVGELKGKVSSIRSSQ